MPRPQYILRRRTTHLLLVGGMIWALSCWSWVMYFLSSSIVTSPPLLRPSSSMHVSLDRTTSTQVVDFNGGIIQSFDPSDSLDQVENSTSIHKTSNAETAHHLRSKIGAHFASFNATLPDLNKAKLSNSTVVEKIPFSAFIFPLHAKSGTHHAYLYVGNPPQRQTVIVDTGSRLTAFPCKPYCFDCGTHASAPFRLDQSSSHEIIPCDRCQLSQGDFALERYFEGDGIGGNSGDGNSLKKNGSLRGSNANDNGLEDNNENNQQYYNLFPRSCVNERCEIEQKYTEGSSWRAFEVRDHVWLGRHGKNESVQEHSRYSTPFVFSCQVSEEGLFRSQYADGIMGMSMYTQTLVGTWFNRRRIAHKSFSLCFNQNGGHLSVGGVGSVAFDLDSNNSSSDLPSSSKKQDTRNQVPSFGRHLAPMQFTPFARKNVWYYTVTVTSVSVGTHVLPSEILQYLNDHKGTIVDSGTTDTFLSHHISKPFVAAWERTTGRRYNNRIQQYTFDQFRQLPVITFELEGGVKWDVRPEAYMEASDSQEDEFMPLAEKANGVIEREISLDQYERWNGSKGYISRIYVDEPHGAVLGANVMMDHDVYFDIANQRLGVARSSCAF